MVAAVVMAWVEVDRVVLASFAQVDDVPDPGGARAGAEARLGVVGRLDRLRRRRGGPRLGPGAPPRRRGAPRPPARRGGPSPAAAPPPPAAGAALRVPRA